MDFDLPAENDPRRAAIRSWLAAHPEPSGRDLADAGFVVPHWPRPWGLDADGIHQLIIADELARAGVRLPSNPIAIGWAAPTILLAGTPEQQQRYLPGALGGEDYWCQLFSEPDAGSDLANLQTRAVRDGDEYVINGSKIWSSGAHKASYGILIARTNPDVAKHKGISYFVLPMDTPGVTMTPIVDMTGAYSFNQVFLDDVRLSADHRLGEEGDGWRLARATLANERVSLSSGGALWGSGPTSRDLVELLGAPAAPLDPLMRDRVIRTYIEGELLRLGQLRVLSSRIRGESPGPEASVLKIMADEHGQRVMQIAKDAAGAAGLLAGSGPTGPIPPPSRRGPTEIRFPSGEASQYPAVDPIWHYGFLFSPALTVGGGTSAIQRNVVAERVLGLPRDIDPHRGLTWAEARANPS